jgi:hypothetical protein
MTTLREAVAQALDALTKIHPANMSWETGDAWMNAVQILRETLAQPEPEPVAWSYELATTMLEHGYDGWTRCITQHKPTVPEGAIRSLTPLYTTPPQRKPLTDAEIFGLYESTSFDWVQGKSSKWIEVLFARAIERAHGIGSEE